MNTTFEMCMIDKYKMRITDTTNPDDYLSEKELVQLNPEIFKYSETCTLDIITYKGNILYSYINTHESVLNEVYYTLPTDGNYTIHHIIIPTKKWYDNIKLRQPNFLNNYKNIYYIDNNKLYKVTRTLNDSIIGDFPYNLKNSDSLDDNNNWYYIYQNSEYEKTCQWNTNRETVTCVNPNSKVPIDYYFQWGFIKNGEKIDIYNRATKTKINGDLSLNNNNSFLGWTIDTLNETSNTSEIFNNSYIFTLYKTVNNSRQYIAQVNGEIVLKNYKDSISNLTCKEISGQIYSKNYTEEITEEDFSVLLNIEDQSSLLKSQQDTFAICYIHNCFLNVCQKAYNNMLYSKCKKVNDDVFFNRDFLWMTINVIKYNLDLGYNEEAQRILDEFNSCGNNMCNNFSSIDYGCGCS